MGAVPRFGVEEEYLLLDAETGMPSDAADELIAALPGMRAEHEFFLSQLETATTPCQGSAEALEQLSAFRAAASGAAADLGVVLAGSGLPPVGGEIPGTRSAEPRYLQIAQQARGAVTRYHSTGTHVHVEVPSRDAGLGAIARFARWSPLLLALAANSPIYLGEATGYASWRIQFIQQWPTSGYPPQFDSAEEYDRLIAELVRAGALMDSALVNWSIRLSEKYPTIELRTADAQLAPEDSVALAALLRALVARGLREHDVEGFCAAPQPDRMRSAHWLAARDGLSGDLFAPFEHEPRPAFELIDEMVDHAGDDLAAAGDGELVERFIARRRDDRGPAALQLRAWREGGIPNLLSLYRAGSSR